MNNVVPFRRGQYMRPARSARATGTQRPAPAWVAPPPRQSEGSLSLGDRLVFGSIALWLVIVLGIIVAAGAVVIATVIWSALFG